MPGKFTEVLGDWFEKTRHRFAPGTYTQTVLQFKQRLTKRIENPGIPPLRIERCSARFEWQAIPFLRTLADGISLPGGGVRWRQDHLVDATRSRYLVTLMVTSSNLVQETDTGQEQKHRDYFAARRAQVPPFVARHFTLPGTLHLHRAALGWDILKAPINVLLSPVFVLTRIAAYVCYLVGLQGAAGWLARRRILLRTAVSKLVEVHIATDLLELPNTRDTVTYGQGELLHTVLAAPQFREMIRKRESATDARALGQRVADALTEYAATRSAVAEMTTAMCTLAVGALTFQALTPGMISMAPGVADAMARSTAIAEFPLGQTIGGMWYGVFTARAAPWLVFVTMVCLVMIGSVVAAFAGVLADPVQCRLGIHRRRLLRLIDTLEDELAGIGEKPFVAREHFYARFMDLWDALASISRAFRN